MRVLIRHVGCRLAVLLSILVFDFLAAQQPREWQVRGDTTGAPSGCSAAGIAAITTFFAAFNNADSVGLARSTTTQGHGFVFSTGKFTPTDTFVRIETLPSLLRYARTRARRHERLTVQQVHFTGWRHQLLQFGPIYFLRAGEDLGREPRPGIGKGAYACGQGIRVLNLAPRLRGDAGPPGSP
jgi:hypothetical protein